MYRAEENGIEPLLGHHLIEWAKSRANHEDPIYNDFYEQNKHFIDYIK